MSERLTLRARQILSDPTLAQSQRIKNADVLLSTLRDAVMRDPDYLNAVLADIDDVSVQDAMRTALS
jgi:hypothetical protein